MIDYLIYLMISDPIILVQEMYEIYLPKIKPIHF